MVDEVIEQLKQNQAKAIEAFERELARVRTGRANLALLEPVRVQYYGARVPLNQVASVSIPEARLIVIKPWEKSMIPEIEKAINTAEIGLTPQSDGEVVRIPIPPLTEERRKELIKQCRRMAEAARVNVRNHRRDANDKVKQLEKDKQISEDDRQRGMERIQKETDAAVARVDELLEKKEKEIMEI
ncbi:MAG: ribosome recycling factor [Deltaproteobacteria bacterium]|nr:MAG: ribosome recycling factor [Deltaproteobacteria bacterium]